MSYAHVASSTPAGGANGGTTSSIDTSGADLLVAVVTHYDANPSPTLSDSKSNTWTLVGSEYGTGGSSGTVGIWYCQGAIVGSGHTFSTSGSSSFSSVSVTAWSVSTSSPLDLSSGNGSSASQPGSITPTQANCLIVAATSWNSTGGVSIDSGFTQRGEADPVGGASFGIMIATLVQTSAAAVNPTFTYGSAAGYAVTQASFKAGAGGGTTGTLAKTNANDTSAAAGTTTILGTLAKTNANDTSVASGTTTVTGTLARTNANDTVVASGSTGQATGTVAYTNANDTSAAAGTTTVIGTLARTNANDSVVASGVAGAVSGTLAYTNNNDTCVASGSTPSSSVFGRDGLGGDDIPYRKSPHKGWDKAEWKRRKQFEDGLESTLRETYQRLMGIPAVAAKVDVIVKPVIVNDEPKIDWTKLAQSYARSNALIKLDQEEADLRAAIDEEDEFLMAMI